jgi:hypothetical protein
LEQIEEATINSNSMEMHMERRPNRSDRYQQLYCEVMYSHDMMGGFSNYDSISSRICPYQYDERVLDLQDQLKKEFWRVVDETLSDSQRKMIRMVGEGATQMEIAKVMQKNQSSIHKALRGSSSTNGSATGGTESKLREACFSDPKIVEILAKIDEIREDKW